MTDSERPDFADIAVSQWSRERPDLDFSPMGPLARFGRLAAVGGRVIDSAFAAHGLDRGEFDVLASLRRRGAPFAMSPSALADTLLVTRGGATKRVDRLVALGLVERDRSDSDRRAVVVRLTEAGLSVIDRLVAEHVANEARLLAVLEPDELAAFDSALRKVLAHLERGADSAPPGSAGA